MKKPLLIFMGIGLFFVAVAIAFIFYVQRGAHIELKGSILKVRTLPIDEHSSVVVLDFRFANPSDYPFIVRRVDVSMRDRDEQTIEGSAVADVDAKRLFEYYPILGQKFNDSLVIRTKIASRRSMDRMVVARFEVPVAELDARTRFQVRVEDVDGAVSEIVEEERK